MKVRITETPREPEVDGVHMDVLAPGMVRDVSSSIGSWLIVRGYAEPEMRRTPGEENHDLPGRRVRDAQNRHRRSTD